jgi:hypothetical protein
MNLAGMMGGGGKSPIPTGYEWQQFGGGYGPGGGNLNPYADAMYGNVNNQWAQQGLMGGYNAWMNQMMPELTKMSAQAVQPFNDQMANKARQQAQMSMEGLGAQFGPGINSGAFTGAAADSASNIFLEAGLAGEQQRLGLLGNWSMQGMQGLNQNWQNQTNWLFGESEAQRMAPVLTTQYAQPQKPGEGWNWGGMGQGAMAGAGLGASFGLPGLLIGGALGALGGGFGLFS